MLAALTVAAVAITGTTIAVAGANGAFADTLRPASAASDAALVATLDQVLASSRLAGSVTGLQVRDAASGAVIYSHSADQRVIPASNEKLMTASAALEVLGPTYRFHTLTRYSGTKSGTTVRGNLYLRGQGDPTMTYAQFDALALAVSRAGIKKFTGSLVADDTWFDRVPLGLDWSWQDETFGDNAAISALTVAADGSFNTGAVAVLTKPGAAAGRAGGVTLSPANSVVKVVNKTVTGTAGSATTVSASRAHGTNVITVTGSIPLRGNSRTNLISVPDPTQVALGVFRDALKRRGVTVAGGNTTGATPPSRVITDHASIPLSQLLPSFLKLSNNGHAELLIKAMGRAKSPTAAGSWPTGLAAATTALKGLGVNTGLITLGDGSGLSRRDWLTTAQIATLLTAAQRRPWFSTFFAALPIAGDPTPLIGGTLASRMRGTPAAGNLHGKTGTLTGVNALSGYVKDKDGRLLVFSSVSNAALTNVSDILDSAAVAMASSGGPDAASLAKKPLPKVEKHVVTRNGADVECSWVYQGC
jgi:D-alanyl-D-alanine carboxypeptidase/D-alanyl-D-alanine-endopeptidase (penicillin-binding protein 4)